MWLAEKVGNVYRHPYNLGVYENLVSVRGLFFFVVYMFIEVFLSVGYLAYSCYLCLQTSHLRENEQFYLLRFELATDRP